MWRCIIATIIVNEMLIFSSLSAEKDILVREADCRFLTTHIPADDVTYKEGIDVRGMPVKPADLGPKNDLGLKNKISFRLILDVAQQRRGGGTQIKPFQDYQGLEGKIDFGLVEITNGVATLDGKPLSKSHRNDLTAFCRQQAKGQKK